MTSHSSPRRTAVLAIGGATLLLYVAGRAPSLFSNSAPTAPPFDSWLPGMTFDALSLLGVALYVLFLTATVRSIDAPLTPRTTAVIALATVGTSETVRSGWVALTDAIGGGSTSAWGQFGTSTTLSLAAGTVFAIAATHGRPPGEFSEDARRRRILVTSGVTCSAVLVVGVVAMFLPTLATEDSGNLRDLAFVFALASLVATGVTVLVYAGAVALTVVTRNRPLTLLIGGIVVVSSAGTAFISGYGLSSTFTGIFLTATEEFQTYAWLFVPHMLAHWAGLAFGAWFAVIATTGRPTAHQEGEVSTYAHATDAGNP